MSHDVFNKKFRSIKNRCNNPNEPRYKDRGGRWIKCEWDTFEQFKNDMYESYLEHKSNNKYTSIERIDNNWNYCKENCRRATRSEQNLNTRRHDIAQRFIIEWISYTIKELSEKHNIKRTTLMSRLKYWRDINSALTIKLIPNDKSRRHSKAL